MGLIQSLNIFIGADTKKAEWNLAKLRKEFNKVATSVLKTGAVMAGAIATGAVAGAVYELTSLTAAAFESAGRLDDLSQNLGLSVTELSRLEVVSKLSGVELEGLAGALTKMNVLLAEAAMTGKGPAFDALTTLGLSASSLTEMLPNEALKVIADRISKIPNVAQRSSLAMDLMGKSGTAMVGFLSRGAAGISELEAKADSLGVTLSQVDSDRINEANDKLDELHFYLRGIGQAIAAEISPYITRLIDDLLAATVQGQDLGTTVHESFVMMAPSAGYILDVLDTIKAMFLTIGSVALYVGEVIIKVAAAIAYAIDLVAGTQWGNALRDVASDVGDAADNLWDYQAAAWGAQAPSEIMSDWIANVDLNLKSMNKELERTPTAISKMSNEMENAQKAGTDLIAKLEKQRDTFFLSGRPLDIWEASIKGADWETLQKAWAIDEEIKGLEEIKKAREDKIKADEKAAEAAKKNHEKVAKIIEDSMSKEEQYATKLKELQDFLNNGDLTHAQFLKAQEHLRKEVFGEGQTQTTFAGKEFGSSAAETAIASFYNQQNGKSSMASVAEATWKMVDENKEMKEYLKTIASRKPEEVIDLALV